MRGIAMILMLAMASLACSDYESPQIFNSPTPKGGLVAPPVIEDQPLMLFPISERFEVYLVFTAPAAACDSVYPNSQQHDMCCFNSESEEQVVIQEWEDVYCPPDQEALTGDDQPSHPVCQYMEPGCYLVSVQMADEDVFCPTPPVETEGFESQCYDTSVYDWFWTCWIEEVCNP